ncbi:HDOD domain-containing protein [Vampirovibrio sp.]|uniref:HDOD domain-containing protein n=1 Tax=Vampirovibrio sp. TaxID=2717857 RepID=UPI003593B75C
MEKFTSGSHEIILKRIRDIPSLPDVVNRILAVISKPNTPASEIAKLISYDPGLTSKVLRMVNSAAYGFQRQISSIQHGIMILGFNNVRGLVLSASIFKLFEGHTHPGGLNHQQFWEHSLGTAVAARLLATSLRIHEADDVFSAAMLHDIGKVVLDVYFKEDYHLVLKQAGQQRMVMHGKPFCQLENAVLGLTHTDIGSYLAAKWKLPVGITEVIQYHHTPENAEHCGPMVYLVALANELAVLQYEKQGVYDPAHISPNLREYFDLDDERLQFFLSALKTEMDSAQDLLNAISTR